METKKGIRSHVLKVRNQMTESEWDDKSHRIYEKVVNHPFFLAADTVYCYVDYRHEVGTKEIIAEAWNQNKKVAVPKVEDDEMNFYYIRNHSDLKEGYRGIWEPQECVKATDENPLVILPGVAFDVQGNRIGYGKGFYDKFLMKHPNCRTIALGFKLQIVDKIPTDAYDIQPNILITEETIYDTTFTNRSNALFERGKYKIKRLL